MWWLIIGGILCIFVIITFYDMNQKDKSASANKELIDDILQGINATKYYFNKDYSSGIIYDELQKGFYTLNLNRDEVKRFIRYSDILQVEIVEDGKVSTKVSRSSQIGGVLLGSVLAGGLGAVVGGLSASREQVRKITKMDLQLIINDTNDPIQKVNFFDYNFKVPSTTKIYKDSYKTVYEWLKIVEVLINRADKEDNSKLYNI